MGLSLLPTLQPKMTSNSLPTKVLSLCLILLLSLSFGSCAAIVSNGPDDVEVTSEPPGATFSTSLGHRGTTPTTLQIEDDVDWEIHFPDHNRKFSVETKTDPWVFGNLIFGGILGIIIDIASGNSLMQPSEVMFDLNEGTMNGERPEGGSRLRKKDGDEVQP
ncbi:MAG: hypothetical protein DWQ01_01675 [Planctomycetota bacterium]|nr:MAG: hypothetical protein DWQ01_01675 [Planctomycetota bacterium]